MKKIIYLFLFGTFASAFIACGSSSDLKSQNDSLMTVNSQQGEILDDLTETLVEVSSSLDSIAVQEKTLKTMVNEGGVTKQQMLDNIKHFKQMLAENKARMAQLEAQLSKRDDQLTKMSKLIKHLTQEIQKKEAIIADLQDMLTKKDADIASLSAQVNSLNTAVGSLQEENASQKKALTEASNALSSVYYLIGTKKELTEKGLLVGGGLTKKKLNTSNLDITMFTKSDSRSLTTIVIPSKKPQLLPNPPANSYKMETSGKQTTLTILDAAKFWGASKILVIRVD